MDCVCSPKARTGPGPMAFIVCSWLPRRGARRKRVDSSDPMKWNEKDVRDSHVSQDWTSQSVG